MAEDLESYMKTSFPSVRDYSQRPGRQERYPVLLWMNPHDAEETHDHLLQFGGTVKLALRPGPAKAPLQLRNGLDARVLSLESPPQTRNHPYEITIGRHPQNKIVLNVPEISRFHAGIRISPVGRQLDAYLYETKSENGTFHERIRLPPGVSHHLEDFDHVDLGPLEFRYLGPEQLTVFLRAVQGGTILL